ncbi:MAG: ABC transporter permease [Actinobacteria bacterium]|nr:ABC transporter permease [Actinomycetota bacterium]
MLTYIGRRILQMIPVFIGVTILLFILRAPGVLPGDPIKLITGERAISPALYNQIVKENALDKPLWYQYGRWMDHLFHGDLGESYQLKRPVADILIEKFPNTLKLALVAILIECFMGMAAGILSAVKRYSFWDVLVTLSTSILVSLPVFWLGMILQVIFGIKFKEWGLPYLPISGMTSADFPGWVHYVLPAVTLASISTAYAARITRSQLLEVMGQDYMRTASAKGLTGGQVIWRHGLKNALIPVVTYLGLDLGAMVGGTILTETVFNWPGIGFQIYRAILSRDWPIVLGAVVIIVILVMIINLLVDISYAFLDPRIRYGRVAK